MKLQFDRKPCQYLHVLTRETSEQEQTGEIRIPDSLPEAGEICTAWGQAILCSKEWHSDGMHISGGVMTWILYRPEGSQEVQSLEGWIPFTAKWDFPSTDRQGTMRILCNLKNVDARLLSSRKILIRAQISIFAEALVQQQTDIYLPEEGQKDMELLRQCYPVTIPVEAGEKNFPVADTLTLPGSCPPIRKLLRYDLQPDLADWKIMNTKLVFRGTANLHILYCSEDDQLQCWDFEVPFSQFTEMEHDWDEGAHGDICIQVTGLELEENENGSLELKSSLTAQYVIYSRQTVALVQDGYSLDRDADLQIQQLNLPEVLEEVQETIPAQQQIPVEGTRIVDVSFLQGPCRMMQTGDKVHMELLGRFQLLYYDHGGTLCCGQGEWSQGDDIRLDSSGKPQLTASPVGRPQISFSGGSLQVKNDVRVCRRISGTRGISMVTGAELGEVRQEQGMKPSLILRRTGGESLWEAAKKSGSTVDAIRRANALQQDPEPGQILLIPVF